MAKSLTILDDVIEFFLIFRYGDRISFVVYIYKKYLINEGLDICILKGGGGADFSNCQFDIVDAEIGRCAYIICDACDRSTESLNRI